MTLNGKTIKKSELKAHLWGSLKLSDNALDKKISNLRRTLGDIQSNCQIRVKYGQGVTLCKNEDQNASATTNISKERSTHE